MNDLIKFDARSYIDTARNYEDQTSSNVICKARNEIRHCDENNCQGSMLA